MEVKKNIVQRVEHDIQRWTCLQNERMASTKNPFRLESGKVTKGQKIYESKNTIRVSLKAYKLNDLIALDLK